MTYTLVTGLLVLPYLLIRPVATCLAGGSGSLAVAAATLAAAAAFTPLRRRVQYLVDQRFNRRRYDAARTVEAFTARLRDQVDLDTLSAELLSVVDQTMQPVRASLWLRPPATPGPVGTRSPPGSAGPGAGPTRGWRIRTRQVGLGPLARRLADFGHARGRGGHVGG